MRCDKKTIWQQIEVSTPSDWEMLRYGERFDYGNSTFSDLHREWLQLSWQKDIDSPDMERFVSDVRSKYLTDDDDGKEIEFLDPVKKISGWFGVVVLMDGVYTAHLVKHFNKFKTLVEITLFHGEERNETLERELCSKIKISEIVDELRTWKAFDQCVSIPESFYLEKATVNPGDVELCYTSSVLKGKKQHYPYAAVHSYAFPEFVLDQHSMKEWLKEKLPKYTRITKEHKGHTLGGDEFYRVVSRRRRGHIFFLFGAKFYREDYVVLSLNNKRLYHTIVENITPKLPILKLS
ncbi:MAG: hypothetical protein PF692_01015 [Kiritimatiellae bacterium]|nr:hypothetical protein [Kiritimatiellia bacterium]